MEIKYVLGNRLLVKPREVVRSEMGILISADDDGKEKLSTQVDVILVGPEVYDIEPGMCVVIQDFAGDEVTLDGEVHYIVEDMDVLGIIY